MRQKDTKYAPQYKLNLVLETLKEDSDINDVAKKNGVAVDELMQWREEFLDNAPYVFETRRLARQREVQNPVVQEPYVKKIRELRLESNLTQKQVAQYLGIARSTYSGYENGAVEMPIDYLMLLVRLYGVSADEILGI
jgi:transposase-like protein